MPFLQQFRTPSPEDGAASAAEQRWCIAEAAIIHQIAYASIGIAASLVATYLAANFGQRALAKALCLGVLAGVARVIFLLFKRHRAFIAIKMAGGMTRLEALLEMNARQG